MSERPTNEQAVVYVVIKMYPPDTDDFESDPSRPNVKLWCDHEEGDVPHWDDQEWVARFLSGDWKLWNYNDGTQSLIAITVDKESALEAIRLEELESYGWRYRKMHVFEEHTLHVATLPGDERDSEQSKQYPGGERYWIITEPVRTLDGLKASIAKEIERHDKAD